MDKKKLASDLLLQSKVLPLYYDEDPDVCQGILRALHRGGVRILEFTNRGPQALENFKLLRSLADKELTGLQLGIGTVKTVSQAKDFIDAGADFVVAPNCNPQVGEIFQNAGLLWIPGCLSPTEISVAEEAGAEVVKIFPGNILGPAYISSIRDIFPGIKFIVTGGVDAEASNLQAWFNTGVVGVGMGSKLITKKIIADRAYGELTKNTVAALELIRQNSRVV